MLEVEGLSAYYGDFQALESVSLTLPDAGVVALLGANAAGKTTTLRAISGVINVRRGNIRLDGEDIGRLTPGQRVARGIVHVPEGRHLFATMTVEENLLVGGYPRRRGNNSASRLAGVYDRFPRLAERRTQRAGSLSGGEQQMCAVGRGLMAEPRILMIDEMSLGLAPVIVKDMFELVRGIGDEGVSVLLVEQQVQHALAVADVGFVIERGVTRRSGTAAELRSDAQIREAYLGV